MSITIKPTSEQKVNAQVKPIVEVLAIPDEITCGISKADLITLYNNGVEINGFVGAFLVSPSDLEELTVAAIINSKKLVDDVEVQKTYNECYKSVVNPNNSNEVMLQVTLPKPNGNRAVKMQSSELYAVINKFGTDNLLTKSEMSDKLSEWFPSEL